MKHDVMGQFGPDYALCRYGLSRMRFRGPERPLDGRYVAFLGGTETFGKFMTNPYPDLVEALTGETCVNFGVINAGIDAHLRDATVLAACHDAIATVIQVPGVQNQSNRFYTVHPRRNDRFVRPSAALETLYPDIDFADIAFTRHLLLALKQACPDRFAVVRSELQSQWLQLMKTLLRRVTGPRVLVWFAHSAAPAEADDQDVMACDPLFVTSAMLGEAAKGAEALITVVPQGLDANARCEGMMFHPLERPAVQQMLGREAHEVAAETVAAGLFPVLKAQI